MKDRAESRGGTFRSYIVSGNKTIYGVFWNTENNSLLYCSEKNLTIIPTLPGIKYIQWNGVVLG
jgi:hypothetical protein